MRVTDNTASADTSPTPAGTGPLAWYVVYSKPQREAWAALHLHRKGIEAFHPLLDVQRCGIGERVVFDTYSEDLFLRTRNWVVEQGILPPEWSGSAGPH